jgi:hypothetical protein
MCSLFIVSMCNANGHGKSNNFLHWDTLRYDIIQRGGYQPQVYNFKPKDCIYL